MEKHKFNLYPEITGSQYEELKEVEKIANDDYELMKKWSKILGINTKNRNQNVSYLKNEIPDSSMSSINKSLKI